MDKKNLKKGKEKQKTNKQKKQNKKNKKTKNKKTNNNRELMPQLWNKTKLQSVADKNAQLVLDAYK